MHRNPVKCHLVVLVLWNKYIYMHEKMLLADRSSPGLTKVSGTCITGVFKCFTVVKSCWRASVKPYWLFNTTTVSCHREPEKAAQCYTEAKEGLEMEAFLTNLLQTDELNPRVLEVLYYLKVSTQKVYSPYRRARGWRRDQFLWKSTNLFFKGHWYLIRLWILAVQRRIFPW